MSDTKKVTTDGLNHAADEGHWPGVDSAFRLIVVAALRNKQLRRGALPRIDADPRRRRSTSIALEEVKRGLVPFTITKKEQKGPGNGDGDGRPSGGL
ncbi:MAG: DNA-directed RNA polymerase subunit omega [Pyrinomonadaceae bacterium]